MTKRIQLKDHIHSLDEIGSIMTAMRNLSLLEVNKIIKFSSCLENSISTVKEVGEDFLNFYPEFYSRLQITKPLIYILIGSERGFCGHFNDNILDMVESLRTTTSEFDVKFIIVGRKLAAKFSNEIRVAKVVDSPNTAEEIPNTIYNLMKSVEQLSSEMSIKLDPTLWAILFNEEKKNILEAESWHPFVEFKNKSKYLSSQKPLLNFAPEIFVTDFVEQYIYSMLNFIFYKSFIAENYLRSRHLEAALQRLDEKVIKLKRSLNILRQEEITQEIQVIMLSAEAVMREIKSKD